MSKEITQGEFDAASYELSQRITEARTTHDRNLIRRIRRLWQYDRFGQGRRQGERWASILKKVSTEGNTWEVWWCDGVKGFIQRGYFQ